jgi:hypothetical protein
MRSAAHAVRTKYPEIASSFGIVQRDGVSPLSTLILH